MVHLSLLVGQLARAETRRFVHHQRRHHLGVPRFRVAVEKEGDERALQSRPLSFVDGKTGAGELHAQFEVDDAVFPGQLPVGECLLWQRMRQRSAFHHLVLFGASALGHDFGRYVRQGDEECVHAVGGLPELLFELFRLLLQEGDPSFGRFGLFAAPCGEEFPDLLGERVLFGQAAVHLLLERTAQVVFRYDLLYYRGRIDSLDGQARHGALPLFPDLFQSKHTLSVFNWPKLINLW